MDLLGKEKIMGEIYNELTKNQGLTSYNTTNIAELNKTNFDIVDNAMQSPLKSFINGKVKIISKSYKNNAKTALSQYNGIINQKGKFDFTNIYDVKKIVECIDNDNKTFDKRYHGGIGIDLISNYIVKNANTFKQIITGKTSIQVAYQFVDALRGLFKGKNYQPRSLPSKVCKYFAEFNNQVNIFYVDDRVVRNVLPMYLEHLRGKKITKYYVNNSSYCDLCNLLDLIHNTCPSIDKSMMDKIMWYVYKK